MAMLKGLRKHNKWILVVGGSLLMIAWLMPQGIQRLGPASQGAVVGELDERKVREAELRQNGMEVRAVGALIPNVINSLLESSSRDAAAHWLLLSHEAEEAGLVGGPQDGVDWLQDIAPSLAEEALFAQARRQIPQLDERLFRQYFLPSRQQELQQQTELIRTYLSDQGLKDAAQAGQMTIVQVQNALAKARGIYRMRVAYLSAVRSSDRTALVKAGEWGDQATADVALIPSDLLSTAVADPTAEELQAHYEKYRDTIPGSGEFGIGYRQPPRIKLEWLKLDRAAIRAAVAIDPIAAYKEFQTHRDQFPGEYADQKTAVEEELRDRRAGEVMQAAIQIVRAEVFKATRALALDGKYKKLPDNWSQIRPRLETIAQAVQAEVSQSTGVQVPLPAVVVKEASWLNARQLASEADLAGARIRYASREIPLTQPLSAGEAPVIFQVRELGFDTPLQLQTGLPVEAYPAEDYARNVIFFTVLDARKESPPESIDEVREQALADWKKIKAYELLTAKTDEYRQLATTGGPSAVIDSFRKPDADPAVPSPTLPTVVQGVSVSRAGVTGGAGLDTEAFRKAVMDAADTIDPLTDPASYDAAVSTIIVPVPERLSLAVARIKGRRPVTWEMYRREIENALSIQTQREIAQASLVSPFSFEAAAARHGWVKQIQPGEEEEELEGGETGAPPAGEAPTAGLG